MSSRTLNGIDISHHQRNINLDKVASDFTICKATEGYGYTDPKFNDFAKKIKSQGRLRGFYHFARGDLNPRNSAAKQEARWFAKAVNPHLDGKTILVLDYEAGALRAGTGWCKTMLDGLHKETGVRALLYTSTSGLMGQNCSKSHRTRPLWVANCGSNPIRRGYAPQPIPKLKYWSNPLIHQYGSRGRLPGYSGDLDLNAGYLTKGEWESFGGKNP